MIVVEIFSYPMDEQAEVWSAEMVCRLSVLPGQPVPRLEGKRTDLVDFDRQVHSEVYQREIGFREDPQEWARGLVAALSSYSFFAEVVHDEPGPLTESPQV